MDNQPIILPAAQVPGHTIQFKRREGDTVIIDGREYRLPVTTVPALFTQVLNVVNDDGTDNEVRLSFPYWKITEGDDGERISR